MAEMLFSPEADDALDALERDPTSEHLAGRVHTALDRLEADPGAAQNRRRRFHTIGLWGVPVISGSDEWLILWEPDEHGDVIVHHIVPAP
ncbi:MAG: hypothetical protein MUP97_17615 [Acidimicrobiia bacterium]|jgi:hypothetical protein|nr:hypothetical protein [Acidimicrobiia bacterium]